MADKGPTQEDRAEGRQPAPVGDLTLATGSLDAPLDSDLLHPTARSGFSCDVAAPIRIGRHVILDMIGSGGMGIVYAAYDPELDRKIAIKLIQAGDRGRAPAGDGQKRLLREAQAMARLSHANVIHVYDVGTYRDQVYVAMEFVEGETLRTWMRRDRARPWREVVACFVQAGRGLAAAHSAGLIHRDFKPENALVGKDGRVHVLDFGLARTLAAPADDSADTPGHALDAGVTQTGAVIGTPAYMAPEQFAGAHTDERTDQFGFCVALFEALYGQRPFAGDTVPELTYSVLHGEVTSPPPHSKIPAWLREVVRKGLSTDPKKRHASMAVLLEQLLRDPFRRRRRFLSAAGVVAILGLGAWQLLSLQQRHEQQCRGADDKLASIWDADRKSDVRQALLATGLPYAEATWRGIEGTLDAYASDWIAMHVDACEATRVRGEQSAEMMDLRMACLERGREGLSALVEVLATADASVAERAIATTAALPSIERCADPDYLAAQVKPPDDPAVEATVEGIRERLARADALGEAARYDEALALAEQLVAEARATDYAPVVAEALLTQGKVQAAARTHEQAEPAFREALYTAHAEKMDVVATDAALQLVYAVGVRGKRPDEGIAWGALAEAFVKRLGTPPDQAARLHSTLGAVRYTKGEYEEAVRDFDAARELTETALGPEHPNLARILNNLAAASTILGNHERAQAHYEQALSLHERTVGVDHPNVADVHNNLGVLLERQGKYDDAIEHYERALAIREAALGPEHNAVARVLSNLGNALENVGRYDEAERHYRRSLEITEKALGPDHPDVASPLNNLGIVLKDQGRHDEAIASYERATSILEKAVGAEHVKVSYPLLNIGIVLEEKGEPEQALPYFERALAMREAGLGKEHPELAPVLTHLGTTYLAQHKYGKAEACMRRAVEIREKSLGDEHPKLAVALGGLGRILLARGAYEEALTCRERAVQIHEAAKSEPGLLAKARFDLAKTLWTDPKQRTRARTLAQQAQSDYAAAGPTHDEALAEVRDWLARR